MSRAIPKELARELLQRTDHDLVFEGIATTLLETVRKGRIQVDFVPEEFLQFSAGGSPQQERYCAVEGGNLGLAKSRLLQAFIVARLQLHQWMPESRWSDGEKPRASSGPEAGWKSSVGGDCLWKHTPNGIVTEEDATALDKATLVSLTWDAEHTTAANHRKRLLQWRHAAGLRGGVADGEQTSQLVDTLVQTELHFVDGLLTSPLHRHTKSPTLWSHRRWLLAYRHPYGCQFGDISDRRTRQAQSVVRDLQSVIMPSGERHPRNYYAWTHARWLLFGLDAWPAAEYWKLVDVVSDWCYRHHRDISGWSFLALLLRGATSLDTNMNMSMNIGTDTDIEPDINTSTTTNTDPKSPTGRIQDVSPPSSPDFAWIYPTANGRLVFPNTDIQKRICAVVERTRSLAESFHWDNESVRWFFHAMQAYRSDVTSVAAAAADTTDTN